MNENEVKNNLFDCVCTQCLQSMHLIKKENVHPYQAHICHTQSFSTSQMEDVTSP